MKVKTYGVPDLTEWHGKVKAGSIEVAVHFTGGTASPSGAQPAYFMTKDPIVQFVIEHSKEFKNGFIILALSQEVQGEHPRMAVPKPQPAPVVEQHTGEQTGEEAGTTETTTTQPTGESTSDGAGVDASESTNGETQEEGSSDADGADGAIKVPDKPEAIEWLKEHFPEKGYTATKLRTQIAFEAACNECGVTFVFTA